MDSLSINNMDVVVPAIEAPCCDGVCKERLCGRMKQELKFFNFLAEEDLEEAADYFECHQLTAGQTLWQEGESGNFAAFIISGRIEINKKTAFGGKPIVVGIYSRGAIAGESSLMEKNLRSETAVALDQVDMILLTQENYGKLIAERPDIGLKLLEGILVTVSRRLRRSFERLAAIF